MSDKNKPRKRRISYRGFGLHRSSYYDADLEDREQEVREKMWRRFSRALKEKGIGK